MFPVFSRIKSLQTLLQDSRNSHLFENIVRKNTNRNEWIKFNQYLPVELKTAVNVLEGKLISLAIYGKLIPPKDTLDFMRLALKSVTELTDEQIVKINESDFTEQDLANLKALVDYYRWFTELEKENVIIIENYKSSVKYDPDLHWRRYSPYQGNPNIVQILSEIHFRPTQFAQDFASLKALLRSKLGHLEIDDIAQLYNWLDLQYRKPYLAEFLITSDCYEIMYSKNQKTQIDGVVISGFLNTEEKKKAHHIFYSVGKGQSIQQYYEQAANEIRLAKQEGIHVIVHITEMNGSGKRYETNKLPIDPIASYENIFRYYVKHNNVSPSHILLKGHPIDLNKLEAPTTKPKKFSSFLLWSVKTLFTRKNKKIDTSNEFKLKVMSDKAKRAPWASHYKVKADSDNLIIKIAQQNGLNSQKIQPEQLSSENVDVVLKVGLGVR